MPVALSVDDTEKQVPKNQQHPKPLEMRCQLEGDTLIIYASLLTPDEYRKFEKDIYDEQRLFDDPIEDAELILTTYAYEVITHDGKEADQEKLMKLAAILGQYAIAYIGLVINKFY